MHSGRTLHEYGGLQSRAVESSSGDPASVRAPGRRLGPGGFRQEMARYLQRRLRLAVRVLGLVAGAALLLNLADRLSADRSILDPEVWVLVAALCVALTGWWILRREPRPLVLEGLDAALLVLMEVVCISAYHFDYGRGGGHGIHFLGMLLVARAVVVPSRAGRTFVLSLPALAAVFGVQWLHAMAGDPLPTAISDLAVPPFGARWWEGVAWVQVYLAFGLGIATMASHVSFTLRNRAYEAQRLGPYVLDQKLGEGGMGQVYRAHHTLMRRPVAIKFVRHEVVGEVTLKRFEEEVRHTSRLTHPNTIAVYDYGTTAEGVFYYAMELLEGADLQRIVSTTGPLPAARVIHVLVQALGALREAHAKGLVHRDVKPGNLFLCERGLEHDVLKVMDFGLVKDVSATALGISQVGAPVGSPLTMSPEILRGRPAEARSDLYALAAVGCYLLTGEPPFEATTVAEALAAHLSSPPIPPSVRVPSVPSDLEDVLLTSLAKDPSARHPDALSMRRALLACADAGRWTPDDADRWWREHGKEVNPPEATPPGASAGPAEARASRAGASGSGSPA
jgi:serine/threonine-protein kinase